MPSDISNTLQERGSKYGSFKSHAEITQNLKRVMAKTKNWEALTDSQKEALEMVAHKIGRILNGDPNYYDSWYDIQGYIKLAGDELLPVPVAGQQVTPGVQSTLLMT